MKPRELILLSPYTYPAQNPLTLADEDMAAWMNAYTALWHPAALWGAAEPPRVDVPYDYEEPQEHHVYAVPESPPAMMAEDWEERVRSTGATLVQGLEDRDATLEKAVEVFATMSPFDWHDSEADSSHADEKPPAGDPSENTNSPTRADIHSALLQLKPEQVRPFFAIGLGYLLLASLSEAMEHENLLEMEDFWQDVQNALAALAGVPDVPMPNVSPAGAADDFNYDYGAGDNAPANSDGTDMDAPDEQTDFEDLPEDPRYDDRQNDYPTEPEEQYPDEYYEEDEYSDGSYEHHHDAYGSGRPPTGRFLIEPGQAEPWLGHLCSAAQRLQSAREVLYPVTIYWLDLFLPDPAKPADVWPASLQRNIPLNIIASAKLLEKLQADGPDRFAQLHDGIEEEEIELCGGCYEEREDALLPVESQLWNLRKGMQKSEELLGKPISVFARRRFAFHPQMPLFLSSNGINRAILLAFDESSAVPEYQAVTVSWPSIDGKQVDAFVRAPYRADSLEALFNLGHYVFKTTREDHSATIALLHNGKPAHPWYEDFLELCRFGAIFGEWVTVSRFFNEVMAGEYTETQSADEFHFDYLSERTPEDDHHEKPTAVPVSGFATHLHLRRQLDCCWSLAAMLRGLAGKSDTLQIDDKLNALEEKIETTAANGGDPEAVADQLRDIEATVLAPLADRLLARAATNTPGHLIVNPCSFARRIALELERPEFPLPVEGPIKACQMDDDKMLVVAEAPGLGFVWLPRSGPADTPPPKSRMKLADDRHVRNEYFEVEFDTKTGGFSSIADRRNPFARLAQQLVFNPGSAMKAESVKATSTGPALGEVLSEGEILGEQNQVLAKFRQRFRAWLGRPVLEMRIEIEPVQPPAGYPWHAYFGCRFAWADERALLLRGVNGTADITNHTRPQSPDFLMIRSHRLSTSIFPGGLPFLQRHEGRMLDLILVPPGESAMVFDIAIGLDREYPMQTAFGLTTPVSMIATDKGPPHIGASGWLYHLDTPNLLLTGMRPGGAEVPNEYDDNGAEEQRDLFDAMTLRLIEISSQSGQAEFRCVRDPKQAAVLDSRGQRLLDAPHSGDTIFLEVTPGDLNQVQVEF